ncbi:rod shape-determining protein, partial [Candidatus Microgenomates bacterium]|nr:rod shape-determining protein [Candidatus Microgenomates bacterium]
RPLKDGVIADYVVTEAMLRYFIDRVCGKTRFFKPEVMICVPSGCTQVERRAVMDATLSAGAKTVYLIEEPLAAAIGAKIPIAQPSGNMIVDTGGGSTEAAVISLGGVVVHHSVRVAGTKLDEAITSYIKKKFNLLIGERMAEEVKIQVGTAIPPSASKNIVSKKVEVRGRDSLNGLPRMIELTSEEIALAIQNPLNMMIGGIKTILENTPPELASDIIDKGIVLSGGTALLRNLDKLIVQATGVPVHVAEDPLLCVVRGTGVALENIDLYKRTLAHR